MNSSSSKEHKPSKAICKKPPDVEQTRISIVVWCIGSGSAHLRKRLTQSKPRSGKSVDGPDTAPGAGAGAGAGEEVGRNYNGADEGPEDGEGAREREVIRGVIGDGDAEGVIGMIHWLELQAYKHRVGQWFGLREQGSERLKE